MPASSHGLRVAPPWHPIAFVHGCLGLSWRGVNPVVRSGQQGDSMCALFATQPAIGSFRPLVPLARALANVGHDVALAGAASFRPIPQSWARIIASPSR